MSARKVRGNPALVFAPLLIIMLILFTAYRNTAKTPAEAATRGATASSSNASSAPNTTARSQAPKSTPVQTTPAPPPPAQQGGDVRGVDISSNIGAIDWNTLASQAGFVYIKASEGTGWDDPMYQQYLQQAEAHHIPHGAYAFFRPSAPVDQQVQTFLAAMGPMQKGDLPPMVDLEFLDQNHQSEWLNLPMSQRAQLVLAWLHQVECATGVTPIIYTSPSFANSVIGTQYFPEFAHYRLFIANWDVSSPGIPAPWSTWHMWQYTVTRNDSFVASHAIDRDIVNGGAAGLAALQFNGKKNSC